MNHMTAISTILHWKKIPENSQWSFWRAKRLSVIYICIFLYFQKFLQCTWIAFIIKFIVIKENTWGLACLDCKYFADYKAKKLKLIMFSSLNKIKRVLNNRTWLESVKYYTFHIWLRGKPWLCCALF